MTYVTTFKLEEVGDYSIFVRENLSIYNYVDIVSDEGYILSATNILASESGSIVYFSCKIDKFFEEGKFYKATCYEFGDDWLADLGKYLRSCKTHNELDKSFVK